MSVAYLAMQGSHGKRAILHAFKSIEQQVYICSVLNFTSFAAPIVLRYLRQIDWQQMRSSFALRAWIPIAEPPEEP